MNQKFFTFFVISIFAILFSTNAMAKQLSKHGEPIITDWWWRGRLVLVPKTDQTISVVQPCGDTPQIGFNIWTGISTQTSMMPPISPTIGADIELCLKKYSVANWAPSRAAFELSIGANKFYQTWLGNMGFGLRYQTPFSEKIDGGFYWKYNYFTNFVEQLEDHHALIFGFLGEFRPMYNATEMKDGSHFYITIRFGVGFESYNRTQKTGVILEFLPSIGYRFADF